MNSPKRVLPDKNWPHYNVWSNVKEVAKRLDFNFKSTITVSGINATEIYSFSEVLGLTIEEEVVRNLNELREKWDDGAYGRYKFRRQPQTFPDVLFTDGNDILFGIELKSWYVLSKEDEPSFRFKVNVNACAKNDIVMLVPWCFSNILSGTPIIFRPVIDMAKYYCEYRNYWWKYVRKTRGSVEIDEPKDVQPYPNARDNISDSARDDKGNNFGRIARMNLLDNYKSDMDKNHVLGISLKDWRVFFQTVKN